MVASPAVEAGRLLAARELGRRRAKADPGYLCSFMSAPDERTAEQFTFVHLRDEVSAAASGWGWQRDLLLWLHGCRRCILLKARQLGATWVVCAYAVWTALCRPGSLTLVYRQKEEEAVENVIRCWRLFESLPPHLRMGVEVLKPARGHLPNGGEIVLRFPDGETSRVVAMSSATASGHGKTAALVLMDEFSRMDNAAEIMKAVQPAAGERGTIAIVSTANGVSDEDSGEGNAFHWVWANADRGVAERRPGLWTQDGPGDNGFWPWFVGWQMHPDRDQRWYDSSAEVQGLRSHERAEQYPSNPDEAFTLTNRVFFDPEDLAFYAKHRRGVAARRGDFERVDERHARFAERSNGKIAVFKEPVADHAYAVGADVATGRGLDYSAAYVVDLATMELAAEFHGRLDADLYAEQLHYLGRWYNTALLAVEVGGGYGDAVIIPLRDGRAGRPAYPKLYRHLLSSRPDLPEAKPFGFPTTSKTRPLIVNQLEQAIRERALPALPAGLLSEMRTFVHQDTGTSPSAQSGCRDDRVLAACIALEMYRLRGSHPHRRKHKHSVAAKPVFSRAA